METCTSYTQVMVEAEAYLKRCREKQARCRQLPVHLRRSSAASAVRMVNDERHAEEHCTTRTLDEEIDTIAICPNHNDYMVVGTYSLVKRHQNTAHATQMRHGSIRVMTVSQTFKPTYAGMLPPQLDRVDLPCAVLNIHFHPKDPSLLGAAVSNGCMFFFRFVAHGDVLGRRIVTKLLLLGAVRVADNDHEGSAPLITQFTWFEGLRNRGTQGVDDISIAALAVTTSTGETKVLKVGIPVVRDVFDARLEHAEVSILSASETIDGRELEAWTVATVNLSTSEGQDGAEGGSRLLLSGGDDSALIASTLTPAIPEWCATPSDDGIGGVTPLWKDRKTHTAGIVSILPLEFPVTSGQPDDVHPPTIPILTGSYDDYIRVFELDSKTYRPKFKAECRLDGGVWQLKLLDEYDGNAQREAEDELKPRRQHHYLLLASLMYRGVALVRVTYTFAPAGAGEWSVTPVLHFRASHQSMVYSCDARRETERDEQSQDLAESESSANTPAEGAPRYTIVSSSFYDMKICTWPFVDHFKVTAMTSASEGQDAA
jgi:diphthine methyl ester acylhydrolase